MYFILILIVIVYYLTVAFKLTNIHEFLFVSFLYMFLFMYDNSNDTVDNVIIYKHDNCHVPTIINYFY